MNHTEANLQVYGDGLKDEQTIKFTFDGNSNGNVPDATEQNSQTAYLGNSVPKLLAESGDKYSAPTLEDPLDGNPVTDNAHNTVPEK